MARQPAQTNGDPDTGSKNLSDVVTRQEVRHGGKTYPPKATIKGVDTTTRKELIALGAIEE